MSGAPASEGQQVGAATAAPLIVLDKAGMKFGSQEVLRDIHLSIKKGETVAVIGESGCGKTVLLKLMIGLLRPTTGKVTFDGQVLADLNEDKLTRQRLRFGFLFQGAALFDSLSVFENVSFCLREVEDLSASVIRDRVRQRLQEVGLPPEVEGKKPAELSGGMKKRVGLARALMMEPEVMLYDEPTTGLDPVMSDVINELILQTRRRRPITSIIVTHDMRTTLKVADRAVMLYALSRLGVRDNQIIYDGKASDLGSSSDPRVRQFIEGEATQRLVELAHEGART
jgi:phospholipid/cholesterol/gamma-HCH transport system ATP-binding protein